MTTTLPPLIEALTKVACYDHPVERLELIETHISWVILTGRYAYKIKKPLNLGFLDFSTLEKRRFYCEEELRLNRRLAPHIYLAVVGIAGTPEAPRFHGAGDPFEYAVKMTQFPQSAQLDRVLARDELKPEHMDALAAELAAFHARIACAGPQSPFGAPEQVYFPVRQNFEQLRPRAAPEDSLPLERLQQWSEQTFERLKPMFAVRKLGGFIRECHGDAHLANMALLDRGVVLFDCLEFNDNLRWIDVMNEVAFVVMDLDDRRRSDLGRRLLNTYLEHSGDYAGLAVFRFYQTYRALVRAKVAAIRGRQAGLTAEEIVRVREQYRDYLALAERYTRKPAPALLITHGFSGSGKTWVSQHLLEELDAIRVRSDVERKRLHGLAASARSGSALDAGLYAGDATHRTYEYLAELARTIVRGGFSAIVDATFLQRWQRDRLRLVAAEERAPFGILDVRAPESVLRARVVERLALGHDASEAGVAVLEHQLQTREPLTAEEQSCAIVIRTDLPTAPRALVEQTKRLFHTS